MNNIIVGIDEAGRGAWAGPLVASAVVLSDSNYVEAKDSKALNARLRSILSMQIRSSADSIGIGWVNPTTLDRIGLTESTKIAMTIALNQINTDFNQIIIDGNIKYIDDKRVKTMIKADAKIREVAAASIIAKVARDNYMNKMNIIYKNYGFNKHVGYGVKSHTEALEKYGVSSIHRLSYKPVKKYL